MRFVTRIGVVGVLAALAWPGASSAAEMRGVTATEIKIGQTMPYSRPVIAFGALGEGEAGWSKILDISSGINGRKINLISLDDSYAPPKTVEQTRRLVESNEVALIFSSIGTAPQHRDRKISAEQEHSAIVSGLRRLEIRRHQPSIRRQRSACRRRFATRRGFTRAMRWRKTRTPNSP